MTGGRPVSAGATSLRAARVGAGLTISEAARRARTSRAAIHAYETGTVSPTLETAERVLAAYGCRFVVAPRGTEPAR